ncbi:hypothetical protein H8356DRAFT_1311921 [Neocallimastix lanati (nom. inval.)]|uniref:AAA-ATPase-like domain-containing protein n=1 Tax=Neocallimastix californiae TaxID=1754190 RepID=A0A1Y2CDK5_9FUNG|nr:hypothetical protein H8356DRAFT_1311921 [Neocallimastix sp. JGI-2020a]ORY44967.1 hypothetical protein LY90DRAFT_20492 [Neocallimastix californiae]|eukprot:ORY44967.1 hypothetical protein LY90DRAFT_20492 [Neocallimastix californiae]
MGIIVDNDDMHVKYESIINQKYFVDKSNIINKFNKLINLDNSKYVCITKPRRFGKTSIAAMLVTYYSKGIDSKKIFDNFKVSKGISSNEKEKQLEIKQYEEYQGKYHTLYFDFSEDVEDFDTLNEYLASINQHLKHDIKKIFPNSSLLENFGSKIKNNLRELRSETKEKFIVIIDEWDYIIANNKFSSEDQRKYLSFLKNLIKDKSYIAFVYMTGILPIAKQLSQSTLNCFNEYSMMEDNKYYQYFGFTEKEVEELCKKNPKLEYDKLCYWYNGYKAYNGDPIFNTWSVINALENSSIRSYWTDTGRFDEILHVINFDINGVKKEIIKLIKGNEISINLKKYGTEELLNEETKNENNDAMKEDIYSKMVTFGYLTYYEGKLSIPNNELKERFIDVLYKRKDMKFYYDLITNSRKMLKMTLKKNTEGMCKILEEEHMNTIKPGDKMDHGNLKRVIEHVYFIANITHNIKEEEGNGKGNSDIFFYPKMSNRKNGTIFIVELKLNQSAEIAIKHIHEKKYYYSSKDKEYSGKILLIGINCETATKKYTCKIEEYKSIDQIIKKTEKKRKSKSTSDSNDINKKLRSS